MVKLTPTTRLLKRRIEAAKKTLDVPTVAADLAREKGGEIRRRGARWRGMCPICGNGGRSDAFSCQEDLWTCHACGAGGDVVTLMQLTGGFETAAETVAYMGYRYGLELPARPDSWYARQDRQARVRRQLLEKRAMVFRRRIFKIVMVPVLSATGASPDEVKAAWEDFKDLAVEEMLTHGR